MPFDDYYEPRDWRKSFPMTRREQLTCAFRRKALEKLFTLAGHPGYNESITSAYGWWTRFSWTEKQRAEYERWWAQSFVNEFRTSMKRAEIECSAFMQVYAWEDRPAETPKIPKPRLRRARPIPLEWPLL